MSLQVVGLEVRLPQKGARVSSSFSARKPMAEVSVVLEDGRSREIVVPVRAGRVLQAEGIALPQDEEAAFDAIHALEGRVCLAMLAEMLSRRDHGTEEARAKLRRYGFREQEIEGAVARATEMRFLDDDRFCGYFIEERKRRGWGRLRIEVELKRKGIDPASIPGYPDAFFDESDDLNRARAVLSRKRVPDAKPFDKLVRALMSKGFPYRIASQAARERIDAEEVDGC